MGKIQQHNKLQQKHMGKQKAAKEAKAKPKAKSKLRTRQNCHNKTSRIQQEEQETTGGTTKDKRYGKAGND